MASYIYLASHSPRRRDLLKQIGVRFEPMMLRLAQPRGPDVDETRHPAESADAYVQRIANEKAEFGLRNLSMRSLMPAPVLAADTAVVLEGAVLGKPENAKAAVETLRKLSGRAHEVHTSVAVGLGVPQGAPQIIQSTSVTKVYFRKLTHDEIDRYCATSEPHDKAGAYAIQGLGAVFVERIEGSYSGVMGLPLFETAQLLKQTGISVL